MAERYFTPLVRQLAASLGVDLTGVQGTGVGGRVRSDDVRAAAGVRASSAPRAASGSAGWSPAAYTYDEWRGWQNPDHPLVTWAYETNRIFASDKTGFNQMMASNPAAGARELLAREQIVGLEGRDRPPPRGYTNPPAPSAAERAADDLAFHAFTASIAGEAQADTALDARVTQAERQRRVRDLYESGDL